MKGGTAINLFVQDMPRYVLWCLEKEHQTIGSSVPRIELHHCLD
jgi:hypothetical protein